MAVFLSLKNGTCRKRSKEVEPQKCERVNHRKGTGPKSSERKGAASKLKITCRWTPPRRTISAIQDIKKDPTNLFLEAEEIRPKKITSFLLFLIYCWTFSKALDIKRTMLLSPSTRGLTTISENEEGGREGRQPDGNRVRDFWKTRDKRSFENFSGGRSEPKSRDGQLFQGLAVRSWCRKCSFWDRKLKGNKNKGG